MRLAFRGTFLILTVAFLTPETHAVDCPIGCNDPVTAAIHQNYSILKFTELLKKNRTFLSSDVRDEKRRKTAQTNSQILKIKLATERNLLSNQLKMLNEMGCTKCLGVPVAVPAPSPSD